MVRNDALLKTPMRNKERFGSEFCRWVYEHCSHEFYFGNIDGIGFKASTRILRIFEWKHTTESLSNGQSMVLPLLSQMIALAVKAQLLSPGSGVFVVRGQPPFIGGAQIESLGSRRGTRLDANSLKRFVECHPVRELAEAIEPHAAGGCVWTNK